jgi:molybdopterin molybdotransferase
MRHAPSLQQFMAGTMLKVATFGFEEARACVIGTVCGARRLPLVEQADLWDAAGRVLAEDVVADRDCPAVERSVRDGFAVRAADIPGELLVIGEVRAGEAFTGVVQAGQAVEIMTGAPMPAGADAVVMVEHTMREGDRVSTDRGLPAGENFNRAGVEAKAGEVVIPRGALIGYAEIAMAATVGRTTVPVYARPRVAILTTGDELVDIGEAPMPWQVRNSNAYSLAAQVRACGAVPHVLQVARDDRAVTRQLVKEGLDYDLLLISGGVSAGKYDVVEDVLAELGAEFYFDRVRMQPGQPVVFGRAGGTFLFGLPGNPLSGMVTFEALGRAAVELICGRTATTLPLLWSRLAREVKQRTGLTRFVPSCLSADGATVAPAGWHGSGDIPAAVRANAWMVTEPDREQYAANELVRVMRRGG